MVDLNPCLDCILYIKTRMESGLGVRPAVLDYLELRRNQSLVEPIKEYLFCLEQGLSVERVTNNIKSPHRKALLSLIKAGFEGQPILERLGDLEKEVISSCEEELKKRIDHMPILALVPLLLFQFPAFLLLLFGPLLSEFIRSLNQ